MQVTSSAYTYASGPGRFCGIALAFLVAAASVGAQPVVFSNFTSTSGLVLNGNATTTNNGTDGSTVLRLVNAASNKAGDAFTSSTSAVTSGFSTSFDFRLSNRGGITDGTGTAGGDGFSFVVQRAGSSALGSTGEYLGYGGTGAIGNSLGIEFDTYQNPSESDPSSNHLGVILNGSVVSVATANISPDFDSATAGTKWTGWIDYNGTTLEVRVSNTGTRPSTANLSYAITGSTLQGYLGSTTAFVGFTAATGGAWENQDIIDWTFANSYVSGGVTAGSPIPEPSTDAILAGMLALAFTGLVRRRSRRASAKSLRA